MIDKIVYFVSLVFVLLACLFYAVIASTIALAAFLPVLFLVLRGKLKLNIFRRLALAPMVGVGAYLEITEQSAVQKLVYLFGADWQYKLLASLFVAFIWTCIAASFYGLLSLIF